MSRLPGWAKAVLAVVVLQLVYVFSFVWPSHDPKPNGLRVGVVASSQQLATAREQLEPVLPGVELVRHPTERAARAAITGRRTYGAVVFAQGRERVLTAPAASFTVSTLLLQAAERGGVRDVEPVVALTSGDPRGLVLNLLLVPLLVTGLLGGQLAVTLLGRVGLRRRLVTVVGVALAGGLAVATLIGPVMGTLPGPLLPEAGVIALAVLGLLTVSGGLIRLLGPAGLGLAFSVFLMVGSPSSGAASAPELLISPWAQIGHLLTPGALAGALKSVAYFDGARVVGPLAVLTVIALLGLGLEALAERRRGAAEPAADAPARLHPLTTPTQGVRAA